MDKYNDFMKYMREKGLSENSISSYVNDIKIFIDFFKNKYGEDINSINHILVSEYVKELKNLGRKPLTINRKIAAIKNYNDFFVDIGIQKENVIKAKDYIKIHPQLMAPYSPSEKDVLKLKLEAKDNKRNLAIIVTLSNTGMRVSELINLRITDLHFESRIIMVKGKGNKVRIVIMSDAVYDAIKAYLDERKQNNTYELNNYVFIGRQNIKKDIALHRSTINTILKKYSIKFEKKVYPHLLRDYFCTQASTKNALTLPQIATLVGHNSINTTRKYIYVKKEDIIKGINMI